MEYFKLKSFLWWALFGFCLWILHVFSLQFTTYLSLYRPSIVEYLVLLHVKGSSAGYPNLFYEQGLDDAI